MLLYVVVTSQIGMVVACFNYWSERLVGISLNCLTGQCRRSSLHSWLVLFIYLFIYLFMIYQYININISISTYRHIYIYIKFVYKYVYIYTYKLYIYTNYTHTHIYHDISWLIMIHLCSEAGGGCGCRIPSPKVGTHIEMTMRGLWLVAPLHGFRWKRPYSTTIINYPKVVGRWQCWFPGWTGWSETLGTVQLC